MDFEKLEREIRSRTALNEAAESLEGQRLARNINADALREAVQRGDAAALKKMLNAVLSTPDGKALAERVQKAVREK